MNITVEEKLMYQVMKEPPGARMICSVKVLQI